jgi:hypothetical protein
MWDLTVDGYVPALPSPQPLAWILNSDLAKKLAEL